MNAATATATTARLRPIGQLVILWPGYDPAMALARPDPAAQAEELTLSRNCTLPLPDLHLTDVTDWLRANAIEVMSHTRCGQRTIGRQWHGRYRLLLGVPTH